MTKPFRDMTVSELLDELRKVSKAHMKRHKGKWSIEDQLCHTHSEVSEVYRAYQKGTAFFVLKQAIIDEIFDVCFSAITCAHLLKFDDSDLLLGLHHTLNKIKRREGL